MNLLSITLKPTLPWVCNGSDLNGFNALLVRYGWLDSFDVGRRSFGRVEAPQSDPGAVLSAPSAQTSCPRRSDTSNDGGNASNWKRNSVATFCSRKRSHVLRGLPSVPLSRRLRGGRPALDQAPELFRPIDGKIRIWSKGVADAMWSNAHHANPLRPQLRRQSCVTALRPLRSKSSSARAGSEARRRLARDPGRMASGLCRAP